MDLIKLITRFKQFGGIRLVREYAKLGVQPIVTKGLLWCMTNRKSIKEIYPKVLREIEPYLVTRYSPVLRRKKEEVGGMKLEHKHPKVIWWCWLQGINVAPPIVKACYNSLARSEWFKTNGYQINVIDAENWKGLIELPEHIVRKWEKKQIPPALFSDLLRLELLIKYGGTWIDSTVLCTGNLNDNHNDSFLDADLFLFQYTKQGCIPASISNWFITACSNNEVLIVLREVLYEYWREYDCTLDYYIFHLFFEKVSREYPDQTIAMPYGQSQSSLALLHHWGEEYDRKKWETLAESVCFHKLAFRVAGNVHSNKNNYYNYILTEYGRI